MNPPIRELLPASPWKIFLGLLAAFALVTAVAALMGPWLTAFAGSALTRGGLPGYFVLVVTLELIPGLGFPPALLVGHAAGVPAALLAPLTWAACLCGGTTSWLLGRLGGPRWRDRARGHRLLGLVARHPTAVIGVAASVPSPFSLFPFVAGASGVPVGPVLGGLVFRIVRIGLMFAAIVAGWSLA
jgi:hypothetical protein